jgi:serine/threonine protein kinase
MDDFIGQWGKYRVKRLIATGGMAEVFEAEMTGPGGFAKQVCLKRIRPEFMSDAHFIKMFQAEARIAAMLHHSNIVSVFDFDMHDGRMFLTMEYVEGCDLKKLLADFNRRRFRPPLGFSVYIMAGLLAALDHAHTRRSSDGGPQPVIHRDVSPHNVLISTEGVVKLADFGIAKSKGLSSPTTIGMVKGKLAYLAPEQMVGESASVSSDLYSAGLVMLEILKGARPVCGVRHQDLQLIVRRKTASWISKPNQVVAET